MIRRTPTRDELDLAHTNGSGTTWLRVSRIGIDPATQRMFRPMHAKNLATNWDDDLLGIPEVSHRKDGFYAVDGQHRVAALMMLGRGDEVIECKVIDGLSVADESKRFIGLNTAKAVRAYDKFRVRLNFDPTAIGINEIVGGCGLKISDQVADGNITAVGALEEVYLGRVLRSKTETPWALARALRTLTDSFSTSARTYQAHFIRGAGAFHIRYGSEIDQDVLVKKLHRIGLARFENDARTLREALKLNFTNAVAHIMLGAYNSGRRNGSLAEWSRR